MQTALDRLWPYAGEALTPDAVDLAAAEAGLAADPATLAPRVTVAWHDILRTATLALPEAQFAHKGGKSGTMHSEHLGHMLTTMQWLQRAYPGATW